MPKNRFKISLYYPHVTGEMKRAAVVALGEKIIGQGETVAKFEKKIESILGVKHALA